MSDDGPGKAQQATPRGSAPALPLYAPYRLASDHSSMQQQQQQQPFEQGRPYIHPFPSTEAIDAFPPNPSNRSSSNESAQASGSRSQPTSSHSDSSGSRKTSQATTGPIPGNSYSNRSCGPCRDRRVRCDRLHPICDRCRKRGEECSYPALANVEVKTESPADPRVLELEAKLASVQEQLRATTRAQSNTLPIPHPPPPTALGSQLGAVSPTTTSFPSSASLAERIHGSVVPNLSDSEAEVLKNFLLGEQAQNLQVGQQTLDWRLMQPSMAEALTQSLLDASARACCSRLPALKCLVDRVPMYKAHLHALDPAGQLAVAVLTSLGARAAPHSAILGVPTQALTDGSATPALYLTAGERREKACRALEARAHEVAWGGRVLQEDSWENLQSLAGLTQLLIFEEQRAKQSRMFLRNAVGMYIDLVLQKGGQEDPGFEVRKSVGTSLFADDTTIAPRFNKPCIVASSELDDFFEPSGVQMPDFANTRLGPIIDEILRSPALATKAQLQEALTTTALWVCGCQRIFSRLSTAPKPGQPSILPEIHSLYALIDEAHSSIQRLQQFLVSISHIPPGCEGDLFALDHFVLLGVRADTYLIDLVNMIHTWLIKDRSNLSGMEDWAEAENDERLHKLRWESTLRVRKCLKLVAFYSQLYLASTDKHVVHHLTIQLELLPNWTQLATQRVGEPGGPLTSEFELTEEELDWLRQAMELACYFTPVAGRRLQELCSERAKRAVSQAPLPDPLARRSPPNPSPSNGNPFGDSAAAETSPFLFDSYGVVSDAGDGTQQPLLRGFGALDALGSMGASYEQADGLQQHATMTEFEGSSWMDVTLGGLWSDSEGAAGQDMWMG